MKSHTICPICASNRQEHLSAASRAPDAATIVRCTSCRYIYRTHRLAPPPPGLPQPPGEPVPEEIWRQQLTAIEQSVGRGRLLNIGCGDSEFLCMAHAAGWNVADIDPCGGAHIELPPDIVVRTALSEGNWPAGNFDAVTLWSGLEYDDTPADKVKLAAHYCRMDGVLAVKTLDSKQFNRVSQYLQDGPARLFTPAALERFLGRYGFRTERVLPMPSEHTTALAVFARYVP